MVKQIRKLLAPVAAWVLRPELAHMEGEFFAAKQQVEYWKREHAKVWDRHQETIEMPRKLDCVEAWLEHGGVLSSLERFIFAYIRPGYTPPGSKRRYNTSDVHPAARWGFDTFRAFERTYYEKELPNEFRT